MDTAVQNATQPTENFQHISMTSGCPAEITEHILDDQLMSQWCNSNNLTMTFGLNGRCIIKFNDQCMKNKICENF